MDDWGWQNIEPWLVARVALPIGPLFCVINGRTRGRSWTTSGARAELRSNLGITSLHLQGIDKAEIIETVHARRARMIRVSTWPRSQLQATLGVRRLQGGLAARALRRHAKATATSPRSLSAASRWPRMS